MKNALILYLKMKVWVYSVISKNSEKIISGYKVYISIIANL